MKKVAIITGASRGIGRSCAIKLAKEGIHVIAGFNKSESKAKELKEELKNLGIEIDIFKVDVTSKKEIQKMVDFTLEKYNQIDILINNARYIANKIIYRFNRCRYRKYD